jgi:hypothetical protein
MLIKVALGIGQVFMRYGSEHTVQRYQVSAIALCLSETNCGTRTVLSAVMFFMRRSLPENIGPIVQSLHNRLATAGQPSQRTVFSVERQ